MDATGGSGAAGASRGAGSTTVSALALLGPCLCLCLCAGCSGGGYNWADHATLVLRPSHHQAVMAFTFGAEPPAHDLPALASRNVAAALSAAMVIRDDDPLIKPANLDFKGDRLFIHAGRSH